MTYDKLCSWCWNMPNLEQCKCTAPCGRNTCPMLDDGKLFSEPQPVPKFKKEDPK
jgi:hypothetical protein